ncbi:pre-mRNA 3' end processing protein WDR33 [Toxorhynchites rutilus septentrionalis]|uniref:pre-mRNA 3' end processing protein WDR33 n=1 Tax=Toxorhynchites rutilus septentrionalis TaxID=329112 RepID=UPI00247AA685|nr:pre-mRNA 3' end processing protein WDR33 [Toxorhynchites rutilus septentrionalis]
MEFSQPPPDPMPNFANPPPINRILSYQNPQSQKQQHNFYHHRPYHHFNGFRGGPPMTQDDFDGKRLRKSVMRKTVDYNASIIKALETRTWQRDYRDRRTLQPECIYIPELLPPPSYMDNPINAVTTRFVKTATNKMRCPIFTLAWTPEGRRLVTGASSGEFTLWNGLTFNFETILQAHDVSVRTMVWSHNDNWMVTGDHNGFVKYWQSNMNNVKMFQAHKEPIRGISFSPTDSKFASCSDDGTVRVWDFLRCQEERMLRGHGADVKCVHWHPQKALIVSGSKDNQQPIKLWDPKCGQALATLHAHKSTVMDLKWNDNGNWLVTASRDHLLKLFDLRNLSEEVQVFRGHKKEASAVSWHPIHEGLFASGGSDGSILFWNVGTDKEVGGIDNAHESIVWTLAWHPLGHILCSGSNDHTIKFWTRNRPGDQMRDKYNLNTLPASLAGLDECELEDHVVIPGMGPEDKIDIAESLGTNNNGVIPGLDFANVTNFNEKMREKKIPYSKPIPRNFQAQWNEAGKYDDHHVASEEIKEVISQIVENTPGVVPLKKIAPSAIILYDRVIQVLPGSELESAILEGPATLNRYILMGRIGELHDMIPPIDEEELNNMEQNGIDILASRANLEIDPTYIYNKTTTIEPAEPPEATEPLLSSTSLMKRRTPPPPTPDPTAGIPSLLQLDINPPPDINFNTDEMEDEIALRNSKKGREREKLREKERREQEEKMKFWAEHNEKNWDEEECDDGRSYRRPISPVTSHNSNSNGLEWNNSNYDNDGGDDTSIEGKSWQGDSSKRDENRSGNFNFTQGTTNFGGPSNFSPHSYGGSKNFGPAPNNFNSGPNNFGSGPNSFNSGPTNNFNPNVPPGPPPNFNAAPPPNFNSGTSNNFNAPPIGNFGNSFNSGPPPNSFNNFNNGSSFNNAGNNFGSDHGGNDDGWNRGGNRNRNNNRGGRGTRERGYRGGNRRN